MSKLLPFQQLGRSETSEKNFNLLAGDSIKVQAYFRFKESASKDWVNQVALNQDCILTALSYLQLV